MFEDLDIYVLVKEASVSSIKKFLDKWTIDLEEPSEYVVHLPDDSYLEFGDIESALNHFLQKGVYASLYWCGFLGSCSKVDAVFLFFNEDNSIIIGVGKRLRSLSEAQPYFEELIEDLDASAGYVTVGPPADSKYAFLSVAQRSKPPKVLNGVLIAN